MGFGGWGEEGVVGFVVGLCRCGGGVGGCVSDGVLREGGEVVQYVGEEGTG